MTENELVERSMRLRSPLRDAMQTLSPARRAEVWEIVNEMISLERNAVNPDPEAA